LDEREVPASTKSVHAPRSHSSETTEKVRRLGRPFSPT
jgi:hypothetical protein